MLGTSLAGFLGVLEDLRGAGYDFDRSCFMPARIRFPFYWRRTHGGVTLELRGALEALARAGEDATAGAPRVSSIPRGTAAVRVEGLIPPVTPSPATGGAFLEPDRRSGE